MDIIFQLLGIAGLLLITFGVIAKKRRQQDKVYITGGIFLFAYSWSLGNMIFIILQIVFIAAALYDYFQKKKN